MPFILLWPIGALMLALFSDLAGQSVAPRAQQRSIEVCTADLQATWVKMDGVIRVYSEQTSVSCARIVVEVDPSQRPPSIPGEFEGHPVLIRLKERPSAPE